MLSREPLIRKRQLYAPARDELMTVSEKQEIEEHVQCALVSVYVLRGTAEAHTCVCIKFTQENT